MGKMLATFTLDLNVPFNVKAAYEKRPRSLSPTHLLLPEQWTILFHSLAINLTYVYGRGTPCETGPQLAPERLVCGLSNLITNYQIIYNVTEVEN